VRKPEEIGNNPPPIGDRPESVRALLPPLTFCKAGL
jgi:hypothetical protein